MNKILTDSFGISNKIIEFANDVLMEIQPEFDKISAVSRYNQLRVLSAFQNNHVSETHFNPTTGYGYDDAGREVIDKIYAELFSCEDALVRHSIINGTQAISLCLWAVLRPGDTLVAATGKPYDTLEEVIGICGEGNGSLKEFGVNYKQVDLNEGRPDISAIKAAITPETKAVLIQKSKGYSFRPSLTCEEIGEIVAVVKAQNPDTICIVDNCYGEFVEKAEPTAFGADLAAGSLMKNPGGGLATTGGYIAGKAQYVELASYKLNSVGLGKHVGPTLGFNREILQGLFMAPHVVGESVKNAVFAAKVFEKLGFQVSPASNARRSDIIQAIEFGNSDALVKFCQGIQCGSPVDSFVTPEPWDMPGYSHQVIMAAGAFTSGASIELSADGPIKPPYIAYMQGGLTFDSAYIGVLSAVQKMADSQLINL